MIAIVNMGPHGDADGLGIHEYEVRINETPVCRFMHRRGDGLATCLARAATAVCLDGALKADALKADAMRAGKGEG